MILRIISIILLVFTGISACFGGIVLVMDPTGSIIQMPVELLKHSPFTNFLIPGLILLIIIGIGSIVTTVFVISKNKYFPKIITASGSALIIWIITQIIMIQSLSYLHFVYGGIGLILLILGVIQWKIEKWVNV